jgi:hypothetical protein
MENSLTEKNQSQRFAMAQAARSVAQKKQERDQS